MKILNYAITSFLLLFVMSLPFMAQSCKKGISTTKMTTSYYSSFNEFSLNGKPCPPSENTVKMISCGDSITVFLTKMDSVSFNKKGDTYYRKVLFHMDNWNQKPCKHDWKFPRIYHCYTRNDTIVELMQEFCEKQVSYSEIYLKTKESTVITVVRMRGPIQDYGFEQLLEIMAKNQHKTKLSSRQIASAKDVEGNYCVSFSISSDGKGIYTNSDSPSDTLMVRKLKYPHHFGLNCGVFEDEYLPRVTDIHPHHSVTNISTFVQNKLNPRALSSISTPDNKRRAIVEVFVTEKGTVSDIKIVRSIHPVFDAEIIRVCKELPTFAPKTIDGKAVASSIVFPVLLPRCS